MRANASGRLRWWPSDPVILPGDLHELLRVVAAWCACYFETAAGEARPSNDERKAMKKLAHRLTLAIVSACFLTGCTMGHAPVVSLITLEEKGPVAVGPAAGSSKVGRSEAWGILVFATGDASISAAMRNGGITRIHHVDHETSSFLGVYAKYTTIVYGE